MAAGMERAPDRLAAWCYACAGINLQRVCAQGLDMPELPNKVVYLIVGLCELMGKVVSGWMEDKSKNGIADRMVGCRREGELGKKQGRVHRKHHSSPLTRSC